MLCIISLHDPGENVCRLTSNLKKQRRKKNALKYWNACSIYKSSVKEAYMHRQTQLSVVWKCSFGNYGLIIVAYNIKQMRVSSNFSKRTRITHVSVKYDIIMQRSIWGLKTVFLFNNTHQHYTSLLHKDKKNEWSLKNLLYKITSFITCQTENATIMCD